MTCLLLHSLLSFSFSLWWTTPPRSFLRSLSPLFFFLPEFSDSLDSASSKHSEAAVEIRLQEAVDAIRCIAKQPVDEVAEIEGSAKEERTTGDGDVAVKRLGALTVQGRQRRRRRRCRRRCWRWCVDEIGMSVIDGDFCDADFRLHQIRDALSHFRGRRRRRRR